jgi:hypothetical protein
LDSGLWIRDFPPGICPSFAIPFSSHLNLN